MTNFMKYKIFFITTLALGFFFFSAQSLMAVGPTTFLPTMAGKESQAPQAPDSKQIQTLITTLEDPKQRQELIKLLELMSVLQDNPQLLSEPENKETPASTAPEASTEQSTASELETTVKETLGMLWNFPLLKENFIEESWQRVKEKTTALFTSLNATKNLWLPSFSQAALWCFFCLGATFFTARRWGKIPEHLPHYDFFHRGQIVLVYLLKTGMPSLILLLSLLIFSESSTELSSPTDELDAGMLFIRVLEQHLFMSLAALFLFLLLAKIIFTPGENGQAIANSHPVTCRYILKTCYVVAIYLVFFIFCKESIKFFLPLKLHNITLLALLIPFLIYLTKRFIRLKKIITTTQEAELSAAAGNGNLDEDQINQAPPRFDYPSQLFFQHHWLAIILGIIWSLPWTSLLNPPDAADKWVTDFFYTLLVLALVGIFIKISHALLSRLITEHSPHSRRLLTHLDALISFLAIFGFLISIVYIWGIPVGIFIEHDLVRDISARLFTIIVIIVSLVFFLRFSHLTTEWLMNVEQLRENRNWRTITPLILTTMRALAIFVAVVVILDRLGVNIGPILAGAGILGLGVGMGAQSLVKDIINGVSILVSDIVSVDDYVSLNISGNNFEGTVTSVGLRNLRLRDVAGNLVVLPNSSITTIVNMTRDYSKILLDFLAPYDSDPDHIIELAKEVAADLSQDADWQKSQTAPIEVLGINDVTPQGIKVTLRLNTTIGKQWELGRELRLRLKRRMKEEGVKAIDFNSFIVAPKQ